MGALSRTEAASLAFLGSALVFGFVLGLVLAFGSSETDPWEERWAELGIPEAEFVFLGDLTVEEQGSIRRELRAAQVVLAEHFGAVTSDFTVYASTDLDALNEQLAEFNAGKIGFTCGGRASRGAVFLILRGCEDGTRSLGGPLAHEYFHILQYEAGDVLSWRQGELGWTVEGSAEYAQALVIDALGRISLDGIREGLRLSWAAGAGRVEDDPYGVGFLAIDWLAEGRGAEAVMEFFHLGGHRTAFESAFGMPLGVFRSSFDAYRRVVAPPFEWHVGGTILSEDSVPIEGVHVFALVRIEGTAWTAGRGETDREGAFEFTAPGSGYTLGVWIQCPREDGVLDYVHAGEQGADGFVADVDGLFGRGVRGPNPFMDGERDRKDIVIKLTETQESLIAKHCQQ
ncbi:MAG: hypothetical protein OXH41_10755 [Chloroflexi bacterium]|nr:hypothetical protein [Chloroflexota bacterium]